MVEERVGKISVCIKGLMILWKRRFEVDSGMCDETFDEL
jgi:hypothetical protein